MYFKPTLLLVIALALTGCTEVSTSPDSTIASKVSLGPSANSTTTPSSTPSHIQEVNPEQSLAPIDGTEGEGKKMERTKVEWSQFPSGLQEVIDAETAASNCKSLTSRLSEASSNDSLYKYLLESLTLSKCS